MNKNKRTQIKNKNPKILYFPNKLNVLSIFLILVIYGALLFVITSLTFPKNDYIVTLNYEPSTYNEEINPYVLVRGLAEKDDKNPETYNISTKMFGYVRPMNNAKITRISYAFSALDNSGAMRYFMESGRTNNYTSVAPHQSKTLVPSEGELQKVFIRATYNINIDEVIQTKEIKLSEDVINFNEKDLNNSTYGITNAIENLVTVDFQFAEDTTDDKVYETNFKITLTDKTKPHHINFQSWLITDDEQVLPYLGLYNYCYNSNFEPTYKTDVNKYINAKWIYSKLVYTDIQTGQVSELLYKVRVADLLA